MNLGTLSILILAEMAMTPANESGSAAARSSTLPPEVAQRREAFRRALQPAEEVGALALLSFQVCAIAVDPDRTRFSLRIENHSEVAVRVCGPTLLARVKSIVAKDSEGQEWSWLEQEPGLPNIGTLEQNCQMRIAPGDVALIDCFLQLPCKLKPEDVRDPSNVLDWLGAEGRPSKGPASIRDFDRPIPALYVISDDLKAGADVPTTGWQPEVELSHVSNVCPGPNALLELPEGTESYEVFGCVRDD